MKPIFYNMVINRISFEKESVRKCKEGPKKNFGYFCLKVFFLKQSNRTKSQS